VCVDDSIMKQSQKHSRQHTSPVTDGLERVSSSSRPWLHLARSALIKDMNNENVVARRFLHVNLELFLVALLTSTDDLAS
jgi:hypothetical protein